MKRVNVIGTTGSGKSTFSKELSYLLDSPYIQMDQIFWKPNWQESSDDEFIPKIQEAVNNAFWVMDGNYSRTTHIKWSKADTVIWLDFSFFRTFNQLLTRTIKRVVLKNEIWPNTGNVESFKKSFFDKKSILIWFFQSYSINRMAYLQAIKSKEYSHINFIQLRSPREVREFLDEIRNTTSQQSTRQG